MSTLSSNDASAVGEANSKAVSDPVLFNIKSASAVLLFACLCQAAPNPA